MCINREDYVITNTRNFVITYIKNVERKNEMLSTRKTKTPDHYPCGHMRGPGWHDWRACLTKQGIEEDEWPV